MARLLVHHFVACERVAVSRAGPDNPYTLHGVSSGMAPVAVAPGQYRFDELWLFARYYASPGRYRVEVDVEWLDGPSGPVGVLALPILLPPVVVAAPEPVVSRAYRLANIPVPGVGRYAFRLSGGKRNRLLAEEFVLVRDLP
jgi:hypothetical protein